MTPYRNLAPLPRVFYLRAALDVAPELVGKLIVLRAGGSEHVLRIVETEAYNQDDPASHSFGGARGRNEVMFREGGIAYVYIGYGIHHCLNIVTGPAGRGDAVLIRAAEPVEGVHEMWSNRWPDRPYDPRLVSKIANGPGNLTKALGITKDSHNGADLVKGDLTLCSDGCHAGPLVSDVRIGISRGVDRRWRFLIDGSPFVSRPRRS